MKSRFWPAALCLVAAFLLIAMRAFAQYTPSFSVDTVTSGAGCDVQGTALDGDGTLYLLDPVQDRVSAVSAAGDSLGSFSTEPFGCHDGAALAIDPILHQLYIGDPVCDEVFVTSTDGVLLSHFNTEALGCRDVRGAGFNPTTGELYLLDPVCERVFVIGGAGMPPRDFSLERHGVRDGSALACDPGRGVVLVADRVCDSVFEMSAATGNLYRAVSTEPFGLHDVCSAGFLSPHTLVLTDPVCDRGQGFLLPTDFANHDVGNMILTMTDQGSIGFLDDVQAAGSGLVFPAGTTNQLFIGGFWLANSPAYVANRDYSADPDQEWTIATNLNPGIHIAQPSTHADQEITCGFQDGLTTTPLPVYVGQESWAFSGAPDADYVIIRYFVQNRGSTALADLRAGVFLDVNASLPPAETGDSDMGRQLAYITGSSGPLVGVALLEGDPTPDPLSNVTLIDNSTYVSPQSYLLDADKFGFLSASDPAHEVPSATIPGDYGLLVSAGPFSLEPGATNEIAFVVVGGSDLAALQAHVDRAQVVYAQAMVSVPETSAGPVRLVRIAPNPFNVTTAIEYELAQSGPVRLAVYDAAGRAVRTLFDGPSAAGRNQLAWDGRDDLGQRAGSGVYFIHLEAPGISQTQRLELLK